MCEFFFKLSGRGRRGGGLLVLDFWESAGREEYGREGGGLWM